MPLPSSATPTGPNGVASAIVASRDVQGEIGQLEGLVAGRRKQLVDLAPADLAVDQAPAQPHSAGIDPINLEAAVPPQAHLDDRVTRREVGMPWVADDQVVHFLGAKPDAIEMIGRGDSAPLEFAFEEMGGDRPALDPDHGDHSDQQQQHARARRSWRSGPSAGLALSPRGLGSAAPPLASTNPSRRRPFQIRHDRFHAAPFCGSLALLGSVAKGRQWTGLSAKARMVTQAGIARGCASGCSPPGRTASTITSWSNICSR